MELHLKGRKVLVSGATKGIGLSIAQHFAAEGADVGICARNKGDVEGTVAALAALGVQAAGGAVDVADAASVKSWVADMAEKLGGVDILVSNVSAMGTNAEKATWARSFDVDIAGMVELVENALPHIEKSEAGAIVMIATTGAVQVFGAVTPYPVVKAGVLAYMKYLSAALARKGVRVNAVSPGSIFFEGGIWDRRRKNEPERYERMLKLNPLGRFGTPEEVARAVLFLASPAASYISGANLVVDGASTTRIQN